MHEYISYFTGVEEPSVPSITFINETTILATVPIRWKDEYEESVFYSFNIQGDLKYDPKLWNKLYRNMTEMTTYFENVEPGTTYHIGCILNVSGALLYSDWNTVETKCNPTEDFDITPEENGVIINWQINPNQLYTCPASWYALVVRRIGMNETNVSASITSFPYTLRDLSVYTFYDLTIFHKNRTLFSQEIRTLEGVPSKVQHLQSMLSGDTEVTLSWQSPHEPNGEIIRYEVFLKIKEYYGCKDLKLPTSNNHIITKSTTESTVTISDLHLYTLYSAEIVAYNSRHHSTNEEITFATAQSEMPSEVFSQFRIENWKLLWNPPENCTMILGPLAARIKIHGVSDAVKNFYIIKQTKSYSLNLNGVYPKLNGVERYVAKIYVIRNFHNLENSSAYQEYEFETPPLAPPEVTNLEIVEIDNYQTSAVILLRWQSPLPPVNGKLRAYGIELCNINHKKCLTSVEVQNDEFCDLWDNFICRVVDELLENLQIIKVFAYNVNVTEPGSSSRVSVQMIQDAAPDAPENYTFSVSNNSIVDLRWLHPWRTIGRLRCFRIKIQEIFSGLRRRVSRSPLETLMNSSNNVLEYPVTHYMRNYTERLYLFPSTQYIIYIQAVTVANITSDVKFVEIYTSSTAAFEGLLDAVVDKSDSTILLNIPSVLNDTRDSTMHIIVKGPNLCEQYSEVPEHLRVSAGVETNEIAWQAAEVATNKLAGEQFKVGDNRIYGNARSCPLKPGEFYKIMIMVTERNSSAEPIVLVKSIRVEISLKHHEAWIVPIVLLLAVIGVVFYLYRRKKQNLTESLLTYEMAVSQNNENHKEEIKSAILNFEQRPASDTQSLSQATTPEAISINDENKEETSSLVKVKNFEDYVRQAIQSGLLDKQYQVISYFI
ncbi:hypothetical protein PUN28_007304 [Cardiocondyla obscurior]|uniref:Fibronectin type-III domain-containing protein n=1 Tax=Cardiocondyla obscurior TaxID=286306 RepID=A0AAW2G684_9HYME